MNIIFKRLRAAGFVLAVAVSIAACATGPKPVNEIAAASGVPDVVKLPDYRTVVLPNGMEVVLVEKHDVPLLAFEARIRGGSLADGEGKEGTSALLAEMLSKGAGERNAEAFAGAVAGVGGNFETATQLEALEVKGEFMARDSGLMLDLLRDVLRAPLLDKSEFHKVRERSIQQIAAMKDTDLRSLTTVYAAGFIYGGHPYARPVNGSEASLARVDYPDLRRYFIEHVGADRTTLAIVGDFDADTMLAEIRARFGDWRKAAENLPAVPDTSTQAGGRVLVVDKPGATQTYFAIGNTGVSRSYDERAALQLVNTVFGGRFTSMLNTELRVKSGLTYGAGSRLEMLGEGGAIMMVSFTRTGSTAEAIDLALATLDRLHADGISAAMLESSRTYVLGQMPPGLETSPDLAEVISEIELFDLGAEYINDFGPAVRNVTLPDTRAVIENVYPASDELVFILIGDARMIRDEIRKYGELTEISISDPEFRP